MRLVRLKDFKIKGDRLTSWRIGNNGRKGNRVHVYIILLFPFFLFELAKLLKFSFHKAAVSFFIENKSKTFNLFARFSKKLFSSISKAIFFSLSWIVKETFFNYFIILKYSWRTSFYLARRINIAEISCKVNGR